MFERDLRVGLTIAPDVSAERAEQLAKATTPNSATFLLRYAEPVKYGGLRAYQFHVGQHLENAQQHAAGGENGARAVVKLEHDPGDVLYSVSEGGLNCTRLYLAAATVVGVYSPAALLGNGVGASLSIDVALGAADGSVTYDVVDQDGAGSSIASGTATHGSGGHYSFSLAGQSAPKTLEVSGRACGTATAASSRPGRSSDERADPRHRPIRRRAARVMDGGAGAGRCDPVVDADRIRGSALYRRVPPSRPDHPGVPPHRSIP